MKKLFFFTLILFLFLKQTLAQIFPFGGLIKNVDSCNNGKKLTILKYIMFLPSKIRIPPLEETFMFEDGKSNLLVGELKENKSTLGLAYKDGCCKKTMIITTTTIVNGATTTTSTSQEYCETTNWTIKFIGTSLPKINLLKK